MSASAAHGSHSEHGDSLNRVAALATLHCLTGCAIGEVAGMVIGTALGFSNAATIALAVSLAFLFGYSLTMLPLLRAGLTLAVALPLAFASDSISIAVMELVDNGVMLAVPGAMDAPLSNPLFWGALLFALAVAYVFAFPVNRYLITRGQGHAVVHAYHGHGSESGADPENSPAAHSSHHTDQHAASPRGAGSPRKLILIGLAAIAVTLGVTTGSATLVNSHDDSNGHGSEQAMGNDHGGTGTMSGTTSLSGLGIADGEYRLAVPETALVPGQRTQFSFTVEGEDGPVRSFEEHGGVRMHLIVVRRDLTGYQHLHPVLQDDGSWRTELRLPEAGVYRVFADFERNGRKTVLGTDLFAAGAFEPRELPAPAEAARVGSYDVALAGHPEVGTESELTYRITQAGKPVDVEPYLGAGGHLVALRQGDLAYLHVHPLAERTGEVRFVATFQTVGNYRLYFQFKDAGRVHTVPLTLNVGQAH